MVLLRLRAALETRANIVIDVPHDWTCAQLTSCLRESETIDSSDEIRLYECWRGCERELSRDEKPVQLLQEWGIHQREVSFRIRDRPRFALPRTSKKPANKKFRLKASVRQREPSGMGAQEVEATYSRIVEQQARRLRRLDADLQQAESRLEKLRHNETTRENEREELDHLGEMHDRQSKELEQLKIVKTKVETQKAVNSEKAKEVVHLRQESIAIRQDFIRTQEHLKSLQHSLELSQALSAQGRRRDDLDEMETERRTKESEVKRLKGEIILRGKIHDFQNRKLRYAKDVLIRRVQELNKLDDTVNELNEKLALKWKKPRAKEIKVEPSKSPSLVPKHSDMRLPARRKTSTKQRRPNSLDLSHLSALHVDPSTSSSQRRALSLILEPEEPKTSIPTTTSYPSPSILPKVSSSGGPAVVFRRVDRSRGSGRWKRLSQSKRLGRDKAKRGVSFEPLTVLLSAALDGDLDAVKDHLKLVDDPSKETLDGVTALHNATYGNHFDVVQYLVDVGSDVNASDVEAWTPLHLAASVSATEIAGFLIRNGASVYAQTLDGDTPLEVAIDELTEENFVEGKENECIEILREAQIHLGTKNDRRVYALYPYDTSEEDELAFDVNEVLRVVRRGDDDEIEWWWVANEQGAEGYAPRNYLSLYPKRFPML